MTEKNKIKESDKLDNFFMIKRRVINDYLVEGKITHKAFFIYVLLCHHSNPYNGYAVVNYEQIESELRTFIKKENLRRIFLSLKQHNLIGFKGRRGSRGSFKVYVRYFVRSSGAINDLECIKNHNLGITNSTTQCAGRCAGGDVLNLKNHSSKALESTIDKQGISSSDFAEITTPYNNNENNKENNNLINSKKEVEAIGSVFGRKKYGSGELKNDLRSKGIIKK